MFHPRALLLPLLVVGCSLDQGGRESGVLVRDSAGIHIVVSELPVSLPTYAVSEVPRMDIGGSGDQDEWLFQVLGAVRLADGRVVVAHGGGNDLRIYDISGRLSRSIGRPGDGPGEFRQLQSVHLYGSDSLLAYDFHGRRVSVFDTAGTLGRTFSLPPQQDVGFRDIIGVTPDGSLVAERSTHTTPGAFESGTIIRDTLPLFVFDRNGTLVSTLGPFPMQEIHIRTRSTKGRFSVIKTSLPFGHDSFQRIHGSILYHGDNSSLEFERWSLPENYLQTIARVGRPPEPIPSAERSTYATRLGVGQTTIPDAWPVFETFLVDHAGMIWAQERVVKEDVLSRWMILNAAGVLVAQATLPGALQVTEIGMNYVLGISRDELDVEHVVMYELFRVN